MSQQRRSYGRTDQHGCIPGKRQKRSSSRHGGQICPGCSFHFPNMKTKDQLISLHMERHDTCKRYIINCPNTSCQKKFLSQEGLDRHLVHSRVCLVADGQMEKVQSFSSTTVNFPSTQGKQTEHIVRRTDNSCNTSHRSTRKNLRCTKSGDFFKSSSTKQLEETIITPNNRSLIYELMDSCATKTPSSGSQHRSLNKSSMGSNIFSTTSQQLQHLSSTRVEMASISSSNTRRQLALAMEEYNSDSDSDYMSTSSSSSSDSKDESFINGGSASIEELFDDPTKGDEIRNTLSSSSSSSSLSMDATSTSSCFIDIKETEESEKALFIEDADFRKGIELLHLLIQKKISLHRYNDFMKWKYGYGHEFPSIEKIIKSITHRMYGPTLAQKMAPHISMVQLPSQNSAPLVLFNVDAMIYDLLADLNLTNKQNLIFDQVGDNPFHIADSDIYDDFGSSTYYTETMKALNINTTKEVLCPLVLYIDEIKLDSFGKLGLEPVVMSLMIYNRKIRNLSKAWRVIGYMPNFGSMFGTKSYSADKKANDYHFCLGKILNGIRDIQRNRNGYSWTFTLVDKDGEVSSHDRNLFFPLAYVIGDAKGNDLLCGRYGSHHGTRCVGRDCDALTQVCDDPSVRCNFLRMSKLKEMDKDDLAKLSFRKLDRNAFTDIWFGAQPYGINGCVPAEPLHQINMGILERLPEAFFERITNKLTTALDHHLGFTCTHFYRQSDRSYPDMSSFTSGVSDAKRLTGREKLSRVFCIYVVLLTQDFKDEAIGSDGRTHGVGGRGGTPTSIISRNEYNKWVNIFEETLLLTSWIYLDRHPKIFFKGGRNSIAAKRLARFATLYKQSAPRYQGMGLKIVKFHQLLHLWWIVKLFGSLLNVDGARGESNAIVLTKQPGLCTQMRHLLLNLQTASERFKRDMILKCYNDMHDIAGIEVEDSSSDNDDSDDDNNTSTCVPKGSRFKVVFDYENQCILTKWTSLKMRSKACLFPPNISGAVFNKLSHYNGGYNGKRISEVHGFTELIVKHPLQSTDLEQSTLHMIRACPSFRSSRPWFDWAMIKWSTSDAEENFDIEGQILMMLDMTSIKFEECPTPNQQNEILVNTPHDLIEPNQVAFVHSAKGFRKDTSPSGRKSSIAFWLEMETECYQMIDIACISRPCFVVVDKFNLEETGGKYVPGYATEIISLLPKSMWSNKFLDYSDRRLINQGRRNRDDDVTEPELKPYES